MKVKANACADIEAIIKEANFAVGFDLTFTSDAGMTKSTMMRGVEGWAAGQV